VTEKPPDATHCNNIGPEHRRGIDAALQRWFGIPVSADGDRPRRPAHELACLPPGTAPRPVHELAAALGAERAAAARQGRAGLAPEASRLRLREDWSRLLGPVEPAAPSRATPHGTQRVGAVTVERVSLEIEPSITVPLLVLVPDNAPGARLPVVVAVAQHGKQAFLKDRSPAIAELLRSGVAVCLPDVRGTGETRPAGDSRGRTSAGTALSATELMLGETLLGGRLRDLRAVLRYLRGRPDLDPARVGLWGDSFAPVNPADRNLAVPLDADRLPDQAEPLGGLLALFGALFEDDVRTVYARGGLVGYDTLLQSPFCYGPHDAVVPGALTAGDLGDVAAALAPRPLRLAGLVDGLNRRVPASRIAELYAPLALADDDDPNSAARWLAAQLKGP
jgi:hypothetical protein